MSQSKVALNTNGALNTKQKSTRLTMCMYWYGMGVVTTRSHVLYAARTTSHSRYISCAAFSYSAPVSRRRSTARCRSATATLNLFRGSSVRYFARSASVNRSVDKDGDPVKSSVTSSSSGTNPVPPPRVLRHPPFFFAEPPEAFLATRYPCLRSRSAILRNANSTSTSRFISRTSSLVWSI